MTQKYDSKIGSRYLASGVTPTALTFDAVDDLVRGRPALDHAVTYSQAYSFATDTTFNYVAPAPGKISGGLIGNGSVASDGTNSYAIKVINKSNSDAVIAWISTGSGTNAAAATNKIGALAANATGQVAVTSAGKFNKGDLLQFSSIKDGTPGTGTYTFVIEHSEDSRS